MSSISQPLLYGSSRSSSRRASSSRRIRRSSRKERKPTSPKDIAKQAGLAVSFVFSCFLIDRFVSLLIQDSIDPFHEANLRGGDIQQQILAEKRLIMPQHVAHEREYYDDNIPKVIETDRSLDTERSSCINCNDTYPALSIGDATECADLTSEQYIEYCNSDTLWIENRFCQQSCFNNGISYNGQPSCCDTTDLILQNPSTLPSLAPSLAPSVSPSSAKPSSSPSSAPTKSAAPSSHPTESPTKQAFKPSGALKYNNTDPENGPWAECLGWEGQDCRDYIKVLVPDHPIFLFFGVTWKPNPGEESSAPTGTGGIYIDGEGGSYSVTGVVDQNGEFVDRAPITKNYHRVVVNVNDNGIVTNIPRRG